MGVKEKLNVRASCPTGETRGHGDEGKSGKERDRKEGEVSRYISAQCRWCSNWVTLFRGARVQDENQTRRT